MEVLINKLKQSKHVFPKRECWFHLFDPVFVCIDTQKCNRIEVVEGILNVYFVTSIASLH